MKLACNKFGYKFEVASLRTIGNQKAVGCIDNKNKKVLLDLDIASQAGVSYSCFFITAHELGHLVLHRQYFENGKTPYDYSDMEDGFPINSRLEWQANRFASELLLPRKMVEVVVYKLRYAYIRRNTDPHMNMVWASFGFVYFYFFKVTQLAQYFANV